MKKIRLKIVVCLLVLIILLSNIMPVVNAVYNELDLSDNLENTIASNDITENSSDNSNIVQNSMNDDLNEISYFEVLLAGILVPKDKSFTYLDVNEIISNNTFSQNGLWVSENSRSYIINLLNAISNDNYIIKDNGFLEIDENNPKNEENQSAEYLYYTEKIKELIDNQESVTVLGIEETYKYLNTYDNEILDMIIEDDEYALQFKNENNNSNISDIIVLNAKIYNTENKLDSNITLANNLLESIFNDDEDFKDFIEKQDKLENEENEQDIVHKTEEKEVEQENVTEENVKENVNENVTEKNEEITKKNIFDDRVSEDIFKSVLAGMITKNLCYDNVNEIIQDEITRNDGIWISKDSRENFLKFLNRHTIYTYSVDSEGFLVCDNIMKNNPELDFLEPEETEVDIEIKNILNLKKFVAIQITDSYPILQNEELITTQIDNGNYKLTFENNDKRIVLLNSKYYLNNKFDLALSDYFVKSLQNIESKVLNGELLMNTNDGIALISDTSKPGYMSSAENVYFGPDSSNYAKVGSVSKGEKVYLLGQSAGWYHIQYLVTGSSNQKSGFVPVSTVSNDYYVHEEQLTGGQRYTTHGIAVQSCDDFDISTQVGSIFEGEGVTLIYSYGYSDGSKSYDCAFVEFSTATGTKRGYMYTDQLVAPSYRTSVARVKTTSSAYSGPDQSFVKLGGAYYNEYVSILAKEGAWVLVEYNTANGRKRGFMDYNKLSNCNYPTGGYADFPIRYGLMKATKKLTVYGGPNSNYANIGSIFDQEVITAFTIENGFRYVEYSTSNGAKRGYVDNSSLVDTTSPIIPDIPTYSNFTSGVYGTSGLGKDLRYYKIGNGPNVVFAVFEQHGWEDAWASDGIELVNIADRMMKTLSNTGISNDWTLYVIPYANPDGITSGYTNNGPGRCTITTKIDMNRCWPASFVKNTSNRNYTGESPLEATEALYLKKFLESNHSINATTVLLDIHGWLNITYGDSDVASYFNQQFNNSHRNSYGSGYLETWGKSQGYKSCLVELPMPSSSSYIISNDYSGKVTRAITNLTNNMNGIESGEKVNETVKVKSTGNCNIRSAPTTSSAVVATVSNGTVLTRVRKGVATANGYTWDKVILDNGTQGYIATNFLVKVDSTFGYEYNTVNDDFKVIKAYLRFNNLNFEGAIDNKFDNELLDAIEEYQKQNGITVNGELNPETLASMTFFTDNDGKIIRDSRYNAYMKIANYYIDNKQLVVDSNNYVFGQISPNIKDAYSDEKDREDANFDSMSTSEKNARHDDLYNTKNSIEQLSKDFSGLFPLASAALANYCTGEGADMVYFLDTLFEIPVVKEKIYEPFISQAMKTSENFIDGDLNFTEFSLETEMGCVVEKDLTDFNKSDWYLGAHRFYLGTHAVTTKALNSNQYSMKLYINFRDYYDWDNSSGDVIAWPGLPDSYIEEKELRALHYAGICKNFEATGIYILSVEWTEGQSFSQAKIKIL